MAHFLPDTGLPDGFVTLFERSGVSLSLADLARDDAPLVAVNERFLQISGYDATEVLGRNCRLLQPPAGAGPVVKRMRDFVHGAAEERDARFLVVNHRSDGARFLNLVYLSRLTRRSGGADLILGSQFDLSRRGADDELFERALREDMRRTDVVAYEEAWVMLGTFSALANSNALIAQARLDEHAS